MVIERAIDKSEIGTYLLSRTDKKSQHELHSYLQKLVTLVFMNSTSQYK